MTTALISIVVVFFCLIVLVATGKKTPSRPVSELPTPSLAVRKQISEKRIIAAIKLYRQETGASLREAKKAIDSVRR